MEAKSGVSVEEVAGGKFKMTLILIEGLLMMPRTCATQRSIVQPGSKRQSSCALASGGIILILFEPVSPVIEMVFVRRARISGRFCSSAYASGCARKFFMFSRRLRHGSGSYGA